MRDHRCDVGGPDCPCYLKGVSGDLQDVYRETASVLGMEPLPAMTGALDFGLQVLCLPSFDPECGLTFTNRGEDSVLGVYSAKRSIWAYLNAKKGTAGFGTPDSWVEPAVAHETLTPSQDEVGRLAEAALQLKTWTPRQRGIGLDGMPVQVHVVGGFAGKHTFDLWFSADSDSAPGRLVKVLWDVALVRCAWELTKTTITALRRYC